MFGSSGTTAVAMAVHDAQWRLKKNEEKVRAILRLPTYPGCLAILMLIGAANAMEILVIRVST
jgi:hypothetical protein